METTLVEIIMDGLPPFIVQNVETICEEMGGLLVKCFEKKHPILHLMR
jgi:hypothetical protein